MTEPHDAGEARPHGDALSVIEQAERNPAAAREIAAARLAVNIGWALNAAVHARGWRAKRLAAELSVGESAVSQVLNGEGNLRVATIGRYARALGYQAKLVLEPVEPGLPRLSEPAPRRRRRSSMEPEVLTLPEKWQVIDGPDGAAWAVETNLCHEVGRIVQEVSYTRLAPQVTVPDTMLPVAALDNAASA